MEEVILNEIKVKANQVPIIPYQPAAKRTADMLHMNLSVSFNYDKQHVYGTSAIRFKPYFAPLKSLELDARNYEIHQIALITEKDTLPLTYSYDLSKLKITLNRIYQQTDTFSVFIRYTAKPNEIEEKGSEAITDAKGLYFINPTGKEEGKPRQIWTQGETQSNSGWFPLIDAPNEKITQEISITVDEKDITLCNGDLMLSRHLPNGKRTDIWKQTKPHAPYLTMLAVGNFASVKDFWRDSVDVNYYVEPAFEPYARMIFGKTPEMMEFFSKKLGYAYPWDKFSQIVVRDFVSGAMENTSAVVHFEGLQHNAREHLDETHESIISHELFHHWFGDLVTCESWSNIALNESFATYGSYLWDEYKYGRMEADFEFQKNLTAYLHSPGKHRTPLIRYRYSNREEVFDVVSYQKGSRILHLLRYTIGDEAFFKALSLYLNRYQFSTVEVHQLRMVFEEVTGEDLSWFFNQWFFGYGHPVLGIKYRYNSSRTQAEVQVTQLQDTVKYKVFDLPLFADIYTTNEVKRVPIHIKESKQVFTFQTDEEILFVNIDADKVLPGIIRENLSLKENIARFEKAPLFMDKYHALQGVYDLLVDSVPKEVVLLTEKALKHPFYGIRMEGLGLYAKLNAQQQQKLEPLVLDICYADPKAATRAEAIEVLSSTGNKALTEKILQCLNDSSYRVISAVIGALENLDSIKAIQQARIFIGSENAGVATVSAGILANYGSESDIAAVKTTLFKYGNKHKDLFVLYFIMLRNSSEARQKEEIKTLATLNEKATKAGANEMFNFGYLNYLEFYNRILEQLKTDQASLKSKDPQRAVYESKINEVKAMIRLIEGAL